MLAPVPPRKVLELGLSSNATLPAPHLTLGGPCSHSSWYIYIFSEGCLAHLLFTPRSGICLGLGGCQEEEERVLLSAGEHKE